MLHAILFPVLDWTSASANQWLREHKYIKLKPIRRESNYWRAKIHRVRKGVPFYSKRLPNGILFVLQED